MANLKKSGTLSATKVELFSGDVGIVWISLGNQANTATTYLQIFDADSDDVTVGTTAPTLSIPIPASSAYDTAFAPPMVKIDFTNGCTVAATTTRTGSTAPGTAVDYNFLLEV